MKKHLFLKSTVQSKARWLLTLFAILTLGVGQMWGAPGARYYLIGDMGTWSKSDDYKIKTRYEKDGKYVFYIYAAKDNYFRLKKDDNSDYGSSTNGSTSQGYGAYNTNAWKYDGNSGIVRFGADETSGDNGEHYPYVFWGKVDIQIKHNWNNAGSWTAYDMTTNSDGTYTYEGVYSGSNATNFGIGSDGSTMKYISSATLTGSPAKGDTVRFVYNSSGYKGFGTETQNTGSATITKLCAIKYNANGATSGSVPSAQTRIIYNTTTTVRSNSGSLAKNGYDFAGWNTANDGSGTTYAAGSGTLRPTAKEIVLYAKWTPHTYTVTYKDKDNETYSGSNGASLPGSYTYGTGIASLTDGIKDGYTFGGWYTASNCSSGRTTSIGTTVYGNKTFYAKWEANITLDANGGDADGSATTIYKSNAKLSISAPTRTGYYVMSYYAEPGCTTLVAAADGTLEANVSGFTSSGKWVATEDKTLYPKWDNHYTVTFDQVSPSFEGTENVTVTYGSAMPAITVPSKTGYTFGGYYTGTNGSGTKYYEANGESATNWAIASNTTLHAKWTGISYQVAFDANEGTGTMDNEDFTYGAASKALTTNTYTRSGYYFLGWNTNADGSGTKYYNGKSVQNLTTTDGGIVTLYAQWAKTYTLYFIQAKCSWGSFYAKAEISYDGQTYYPKGTGNGTAMTNDARGVYMSNFTYNSSHNFGLYKIEGVPEGSQIKFSNNGSDPRGNMSWSPDKPYYLYGNSTWYALTRYANPADVDTISTATNMSAHVGDTDYGIDEHTDGQYAIVELPASTWYTLKYHNWLDDGWSGCTATGDASNMITSGTSTGVSGEWKLNGDKDVHIQTSVAGEYKFKLNGWNSGAPLAQIYYPVGVSLTRSPSEALAGATTTVSLTATPAKTYLKPYTYYYQISTDNGSTWTTIAETSSTTYDYTFAAQKCKFRVILKNSAGLRSTSGTQDFSTYSTKSFYVYNPYNNSTNKWRWLHLYTWDSNNGNTLYNGTWDGTWGYINCADAAGTKSTTCHYGNMIEAKGGNWFYITIDERANCFMLVGEPTYSSHQTITCYVNNYIADGKYMIYTESNQNKVVAYQAKGASDYRLKYTYGSPAKYRYSPIYNTTLDGTTVTTSMWMDASSGTSLTIQQGSGNNTWTDKKTYTNSSNGFGGLVDSDHRGHGYVFQMQINFNTSTPTNSTISNVAVYNGPFYVRTDGLNGGWNVYEKADHTMHHSVASLTSGSPAYDYYLCKWIGTAGTNVKFTVADDYNPELVESLEGDKNSTDPLYNRQTLPTATNVRFSWNSRTNTLTRSYLSGSTDEASRYLVLVETSGTKGKIYNESGTVATNNELFFADMGNWVYQIIMRANPGAAAKVTAQYNTREAEFIPSSTLIGGTGSSKYTYRIIYDFKTNELTNAWVPDGTDITSEIDLNTNVMIIRNGQGAGIQIHFTGSGKVIHAKKLLGVMEFAYDDMVGKMSSWNTAAYDHCMYYISFPYDVKVSDIFGVGEMGVDWRLQYYDGAERASKGFFRGDGTTTFWKDVPADGTLKAYVGYSLLLNRIKFNDRTSDLWENKGSGSKLYLYFPSQKSFESDSIIASATKTISVPSHECTINRTFETASGTVSHKFTDSHWNMMGMPLFENQSNVETSKFVTTKADQTTPFETNTGYFYEWTPSTNSFAVRSTSGYQFKSMHGYMVQFTGSVQFSGSSLQPVPSPIVAHSQKQDAKNYMVELELLRENEPTSRAYVELRDEACDTFALNEDMYMLYTSMPADIYTMAGNYDVSANVLSVQSHTIPVGVEVHKAGNYTFTMPSNFDGTVTIIDTYAQTRTNLAIEDYEVTLNKGTITDRFQLEININKVPTAIDGVEDGTLKDGKAHKFIENGQMYILRDGKVFDARGAVVK